MTLLAVMLGGALGSAGRYGLSVWLNPTQGPSMPWGTVVANVLGCLAIGWLSASLSHASEAVRMGILVGVLGGFTTFSSFGLESMRLFQAGQISQGLIYVTLSNLGGLAGVWIGLKFSA